MMSKTIMQSPPEFRRRANDSKKRAMRTKSYQKLAQIGTVRCLCEKGLRTPVRNVLFAFVYAWR